MNSSLNKRWLLKMAWRDSRRSRSRLMLFTSSIILGVAALVAINSFKESLQRDINDQAKDLLGADLVIYSNQPITDSVMVMMDTLGGDHSFETSFASMIFFPKNQGSRLVNVRALKGNFPYYGSIETTPESANLSFRLQQKALVDKTIMLQFEAENGDSVKIGNLSFLIEGALKKLPGQSGIAATVSPPVYIPLKYLDKTGLVQKGSRITYRHYFKFDPETDVGALVKSLEPVLEKEGLRHETVDMRKESIGRTFENLASFLNLVGFVALLLGCVGVASSVHIYVKEKLASVAILRCIGAKGSQAFLIYLIQILGMGLLGSFIGTALGSSIQTILPQLFMDFLPLEVNTYISWKAIVQGFLIGTAVSLLFALYPLINIRRTSPLRTLRAEYEEKRESMDLLKWLIGGLIILFIFGFSYWQIEDWQQSGYFTLSVVIAFLFLTAMGRFIMWLVRKYFPTNWHFIGRQSLANLYRPNNQTLILIISIGLGTALITTLFFIQSLLINKVQIASIGDQPNMVLFDIQTQQKEEIAQLTLSFDLPLIQQVPIITMRLLEIKGKTKEQSKADSLEIPDWVYDREYRVTYRDSLIDSEETVEGAWTGKAPGPQDPIIISLEEVYAKRMKAEVGDEVTFNVQGAIITTQIGHLRKVNWNRVQTNFLIVFPLGVLEQAPQFHVLMTKTNSSKVSADFQRTMVKKYPNVSVIDLTLILNTLDDILQKVSFVIRFMALFSITTGLLVLVSSVVISKFQRIQESVLLRTLGASKKQIISINTLEYFYLGSLASATGILLSLAATWALAYFLFEVDFIPDLTPMIVVYLVITGITVLIGITNSRSVIIKPPLEILRNEI